MDNAIYTLKWYFKNKGFHGIPQITSKHRRIIFNRNIYFGKFNLVNKYENTVVNPFLIELCLFQIDPLNDASKNPSAFYI